MSYFKKEHFRYNFINFITEINSGVFNTYVMLLILIKKKKSVAHSQEG